MKKFTATFSLLLLISCATVGPTGTYVEPFGKYSESYSYDVDASFNEAWSALIDYSSTAFFGIDNFERESGLLTLSFGVEDPNLYLDCGTLLVMNRGNITFDGSYVDYARIYESAEFTGLMNISVREVDKNTSNIRVNTRYIFTTTGQVYDPMLNMFRPTPSVIFNFDSGGSDTEGASTIIEGTGGLRTCMPTYKAEKAIIDFIKNYK